MERQQLIKELHPLETRVLLHFKQADSISSERLQQELGYKPGQSNQAFAWLEAHGDAPFFLWVHYVEPHAPYRLHGEFLEPLGIPSTAVWHDEVDRPHPIYFGEPIPGLMA